MLLRLLLTALLVISASSAFSQTVLETRDAVISRILSQVRQSAPGPNSIVRETVEKLRSANPSVTQATWNAFAGDMLNAMLEPVFARGQPVDVHYRRELEKMSTEQLVEIDRIMGSPVYHRFLQISSDPALGEVLMLAFTMSFQVFATRLDEIARAHGITVPSKR